MEVSTFASSTQSHTSALLTTSTSGQATGSLLSWGGFRCPRMGTIRPPHRPRGALSAPLRRHIPPPAPQKRSSTLVEHPVHRQLSRALHLLSTLFSTSLPSLRLPLLFRLLFHLRWSDRRCWLPPSWRRRILSALPTTNRLPSTPSCLPGVKMSCKAYVACLVTTASVQRVPKPDPIPGISFDTRPDPIQF